MFWRVGAELSINDDNRSPQIQVLPQFPDITKINCGISRLDSHNLVANKNRQKSSKRLKSALPKTVKGLNFLQMEEH